MQNLSKFQFAVRLTIVLLVSIIMFSCSKSAEVTPQSKLVGTWKLTSLTVKEGNDSEQDLFGFAIIFVPCLKDFAFVFNSKGELSSDIPSNCKTELADFSSELPGEGETVKYEATATQLTISNSDGTKEVLDYTIVDTKLTIIQTTEEDGVKPVSKLGFTKK